MESSRGCSRTGLLPECSPESLYREIDRKREQREGSEKASWERGKQDDKTEEK